MKHRLWGLRGNAYVAKYKQIYKQEKTAILSAFNKIVEKEGRFTPKHLGYLCNKFRLPCTVMDEFLPDITDYRYPTGTWERLKNRGFKARDIGVSWG
ncbi:MAG: hypothetical protein F6K31_03100 [Symploca sp. SIO2G7]|nr:hypothetical protein [Symploca sp. SIO2G7]